MHRDLGDRWRVASVLEGLAQTACARALFERAIRLFGAAETLRETIATPVPPCERADNDRSVAAARARLGGALFARVRAQGRAMKLEEAIVHAMQEEPGLALEPPVAPSRELTAREIEVLKLVAEGLTDAQVAERLFLSPRTVGHHLRSIYRKLRVPSRVAAVRVALERELI